MTLGDGGLALLFWLPVETQNFSKEYILSVSACTFDLCRPLLRVLREHGGWWCLKSKPVTVNGLGYILFWHCLRNQMRKSLVEIDQRWVSYLSLRALCLFKLPLNMPWFLDVGIYFWISAREACSSSQIFKGSPMYLVVFLANKVTTYK